MAKRVLMSTGAAAMLRGCSRENIVKMIATGKLRVAAVDTFGRRLLWSDEVAALPKRQLRGKRLVASGPIGDEVVRVAPSERGDSGR